MLLFYFATNSYSVTTMSNNKIKLWTTFGSVLGGIATFVMAVTPFIQPGSEPPPTPRPASSPPITTPTPSSMVKEVSSLESRIRFFCG